MSKIEQPNTLVLPPRAGMLSNKVDLSKVLLAEFENAPPVRYLVAKDHLEAGSVPAEQETIAKEGETLTDLENEFFPDVSNPVGTVSGLRLLRVIAPGCKEVIAQQDPMTKIVPLGFIPKEGVILCIVNPALTENQNYGWKLIALGAPINETYAPIIAMRVASSEENRKLNKMYPKWLERARELDDRKTEELTQEALKRIKERKAAANAPGTSDGA